ncbi:hypothetical protein QQ045_022280 [Rhodiola kirilowii]
MKSFWKHLWRMKMQGKVKIFMWRLYHDFLPSALNLARRGCGSDLQCKVCGFGVESSLHVMLECWWAQAFWRSLRIDCGFLDIKFSSTGDWLWFSFQHQPRDELLMLYYGARLIWYNRNLVTHGGDGLQVEVASLSIRALVANFLKPGFKFIVSVAEGSSRWEAPDKPFIKINCDGSWDPRTNEAGFGCVARDENGIILGVLADFIEGIHSVERIEVLAISKAMDWAALNGCHYCIFETDCGEVFSIISQCKDGPASISALARNCQQALVLQEGWRVALIRREANSLADFLANKARRERWSWNSVFALPRLPGLFAFSESVLV